MPDLSSTFLGVELQNWVMSGAIVLLVGIAHLALGWLTRRLRAHKSGCACARRICQGALLDRARFVAMQCRPLRSCFGCMVCI